MKVEVLLQAMKEDPPLDQKCRDKFLVQSVIVPSDRDFTNVPSVWANIEQTNKSSIQERKIRVNFLPADDLTSTPASKINGVNHHERIPSQYSPSPDAVTPHPSSTLGAMSTPESRPAGSKDLGEAKESAFNPATAQVPFQQAAQRVANAIPLSTEDVKAQLAEAQVQIARLKDQLAEQTGLRQRKPTTEKSSSEGTSGMQQVQRQAEASGVSVQVVAILCLISFLIAYFLF